MGKHGVAWISLVIILSCVGSARAQNAREATLDILVSTIQANRQALLAVTWGSTMRRRRASGRSTRTTRAR